VSPPIAKDSAFDDGPARSRRGLLIVLSVVALGLAAWLLFTFADHTPTTPESRRLFGLWRMRTALPAGGLILVALLMLTALRSRSVASGMTVAVVMVSLAVGALELAGRAGLVPWAKVFAPKADGLGALGTKPEPGLNVSSFTRMDIAASWGVPNDPIAFTFKTDRHGYRNEPDLAEADVYLLGDSILVAALLPFQQTLSARLASRLNRSVKQVALINTAPRSMQRHFSDTKLSVRNKLVLQFVFDDNDLIDTAWIEKLKGEQPSYVQKATSLTNQLWNTVAVLSQPTVGLATNHVCTINSQTYAFFWTKANLVGTLQHAKMITDDLEAMGRDVRAAGGRFGVVLIPGKLRSLAEVCKFPAGSDLLDTAAHMSPLHPHMQAWAQGQQDIPVLDLLPVFLQRAKVGEVGWFTWDTHWNAAGHDMAAQAVAAWGFVSKAP
jgi:hypothetical protein